MVARLISLVTPVTGLLLLVAARELCLAQDNPQVVALSRANSVAIAKQGVIGV